MTKKLFPMSEIILLKWKLQKRNLFDIQRVNVNKWACYLLRLESKEKLLLDDHKGAVVETAAVSELLKKRYNDSKKANLTFYRDKNGFEVDIITDWKKNFAIEVKSKSDVEKKLSTSVRTYVGLRTDSVQGSVFYLGDVSCEINGIRYVSWSEWGN